MTNQPFTLDSGVTSKPPVAMVCGNCQHYEPQRNPQTGRVQPSYMGRCAWRPDIKWPMAFRSEEFMWSPYSNRVSRDTNAETCACFKEKV